MLECSALRALQCLQVKPSKAHACQALLGCMMAKSRSIKPPTFAVSCSLDLIAQGVEENAAAALYRQVGGQDACGLHALVDLLDSGFRSD